MEIWLRTNARALLFGMLGPMVLELAGVAMIVGWPIGESPVWLRVLGIVLVGFSSLLIVALAWQMRKPRLGYANGELLVWLRGSEPIRVPIEIVECFLLGQAPSLLPTKKHRHTDTSALIVRIADKAADWHHLDVKPQLGKWCEGYITIRGTWCEPLSIALVNKLNQRLADVSRAAIR
jgi:hypothetical protein